MRTSLDYMHSNLWWDHMVHREQAESAFGRHYASLSVTEQQLYFQDFVLDLGRCGSATQGAGLQYNVHLDNYYKVIGDSFGCKSFKGYYNLGGLDHWGRYWFSHYLMQALRGLAEGPTGLVYRHGKGILHNRKLYFKTHAQLEPQGQGSSLSRRRDGYNLKSNSCRPKEDEHNFAHVLHRLLFAFLGSVYKYICPTP